MSAGTWTWVDLARRIGGPRAGLTAAILWIVPFPFYLRMTFAAYAPATHLGTVVFSGLVSWFAYRGLVDGTMARDRSALATGLALGLGCFWAFSFWPLAIPTDETSLDLARESGLTCGPAG